MKICFQKEAIEFLWLNKNMSEKKANVRKIQKSQNSHNQCKIIHYYKRSRRQHPISSSKYRILSEIKSHVNKKNWSKVKNLLLLLLNFSNDIEPLLWRYCLIFTLYGHVDNLANVFQFFEMCIGSIHSDKNVILKNILYLDDK